MNDTRDSDEGAPVEAWWPGPGLMAGVYRWLRRLSSRARAVTVAAAAGFAVAAVTVTAILPVRDVDPLVGCVSACLLFGAGLAWRETVASPAARAATDIRHRLPLEKRRTVVAVAVALALIVAFLLGRLVPQVVGGTVFLVVVASFIAVLRPTRQESTRLADARQRRARGHGDHQPASAPREGAD